jgi:hypothetical protein
MLDRNLILKAASMLLAGVLAGGIFAVRGEAQSQSAVQTVKPATPAQMPAAAPHRYQPDRFAGKAGRYYTLVWGVDSLSVKWAEAGEIIRFAYRVLDPDKAKMLNDKQLPPSLIDPQAGVQLVVPALEQVGFLRQSGPPEAGKVYWMAFSNSGRRVKRGDHVIVQIGQFRADGLVVD